MGKPLIRLNPQIDSIRNRVLLEKAVELLLSCVLLLPQAKEYSGKGRPRYDYRIVLLLSILRTLLRKRYADYESQLRTDVRIQSILGISKLPCKSTMNNYDLKVFTIKTLYELNKKIIGFWVKKPVDLALDASGIRLVGRSVWFNIRTKRKIRKKDCDKVHIAASLCSLLITDFAITNSRKNDSPFLRSLLKGYKRLGLILADKGYSNKTNALFVCKKEGAFFSPFKLNANAKGLDIWAYLQRIWKIFPTICQEIYNKRNVVEAVFSALKRKYGDRLYHYKWYMRRREMAMRFIAYNIRVIISIQIARERNINLWVKA